MQCVATNKAGNRCGQRALIGTTVCRLHGGAAPQVMAKARERILLAANDAASLLHQQVLGMVHNGKKGRGRRAESVEQAVRQRAAVAVLRMAVEMVMPEEVHNGTKRTIDYSRLNDEQLEQLAKISDVLLADAFPVAPDSAISAEPKKLTASQVIDVHPEDAAQATPKA